MTRHIAAAALAATLMTGLAAPALAQGAPMSPRPEAAAQARFEQDRQSILAMAGDYRVRFEFDETTPFLDGYEPREPTRSGGHEIVRVIADTGTFISLQHTLVAEHGGEVIIIKHWRQDWTYQPQTVLTYTGPDTWALAPVAEADRAGAWSQTVWQTDDSPRYGGVGRWDYSNGVASWESRTWRPLARRDATRSPPYDRYDALNRHVITPTGWVHEQDNFKLRQGENGLETVVHEFGVNTYTRFDDYNVAAGDAYWTATAAYWAAVRGLWDEAIAAGTGTIHVDEEAEWGSEVSEALMTLADRIQGGEIATEAAVSEAARIIAEETGQGG